MWSKLAHGGDELPVSGGMQGEAGQAAEVTPA